MSTPSTADEITSPDNSISHAPDTARIMHWSIYGRPGAPSTTRATASSWKHKPFSKPVTRPWSHVIPSSELPKLLNGFIPNQMEDKWFVYTDGPDAQGNAAVRFFRSWTGYAMVSAKLVMSMDGEGRAKEEDARFTELTWETDKEMYNGDMDAPGTVLGVAQWCMGCQLGPKEREGSAAEENEEEAPAGSS
ncbi:hypothetical protein DPSP01_004921 [Paraphaeosphaeria sporulosa]|uniref:Uncharacterized protein n=1 Tax=Paraphaeosphaeria sporulosa TaxID=1460663 RepID=A0A177C905_9PLEO|nr:uncharacterized protein CC84DRAFT_1166979 [Paraphaeosphaeria sporulosa]OAG03258.1 hypothetical protein CC84DRAFT_1166979 [Paraphaeosphaeria sporulosa]